MPSCDTCDRHWTPTSMRPDGTCPTCGQKLELRRPAGGSPAVDDADQHQDLHQDQHQDQHDEVDARPGAPWHFKVLLVALIVYLAWRGVQGIDWIADHL